MIAPFPEGHPDERELLLGWLDYLRGAVLRKVAGIDEEQARWRPDGRLVSLEGIVSHLTHAEWRWIEGGMERAEVTRDESEFRPGAELPLAAAVQAYQERASATNAYIRQASTLSEPCRGWMAPPRADLRWVVLHLINETARHAGHADAVRELLDGVTGE